MDPFLAAYIAAALFSSVDDNDVPLDKKHSAQDLAPMTGEKFKADCEAFEKANEADIEAGALKASAEFTSAELAAHDFWLTRNGHGAGFWDDSRWPEDAGKRMTDSSDGFGPCDLYVGDDGLLYC